MNKLKNIVVSLLLILISSVSFGADIERHGSLNLVDGSSDFAPLHEFAAGNFGKTFFDTYAFSSASSFDADANISWLDVADNQGLKVTGFELYKVGSNTPVLTGVQFPLNSLWLFLGHSFSAGDYLVAVRGLITTNDAITYSGNILVSAVPEASSVGMLMLGLVLLGVYARSRNVA